MCCNSPRISTQTLIGMHFLFQRLPELIGIVHFFKSNIQMKPLMWLNVTKSILFSIQLCVRYGSSRLATSRRRAHFSACRSPLNVESLPDPKPVAAKIRHQLAAYTQTDPNHIVLFPNGMAALHAALRALQKLQPNKGFAQFGFPYGDTLKLLEHLNAAIDALLSLWRSTRPQPP